MTEARERYESPALPQIRKQLNRKLADCENAREYGQMMINHLLDYIAGMEPRANGKLNSALQRVTFLEAENNHRLMLLGRVASASLSLDMHSAINDVIEYVASLEKVDSNEWADAIDEIEEEWQDLTK